ncbi:FadR/GntR family transcriptional regulator [Pseudomonas sp. RIT411]|uniref:FadR/GntR family transcriptional regulator n=1 Tax=Pseudomonas sp. RIT411 TaxID=2202160 RepID=UPI000D393F18|nr:FadR/GntR family transcriptional regulator [Pseudomonas sp. RIT 411]RAU42575.1 FadR family transcriptional regulator [Pseudomonas sp. RIT 411]
MTLPTATTERKLYQKIADRLRQHIREGAIEAGTRLPPERDLAQLLGVSRPSLREALIALEIEGSIEVRQGSGIYVNAALLNNGARTSTLGESPSELMHARAIIEGAAIVLACSLGGKADYRYLAKCIQNMSDKIAQGLSPMEDDRRFHCRLARMSGNSTLVRIITSLFDERHSPISTHVAEQTESQKTWGVAVAEHEAILRAVEARDLIGAQTAMRHHLLCSEARWLEGFASSEE